MDHDSISIEINDKYTRIVDAQNKSGKIELSAVGIKGTVPHFFADESEKITEAQSDLIREMIDNLRIKKKNIKVVIPDSYTFSHILEFTKLNEKELFSAVRYQADQFIPMPIDEVSLDIEIISENKTENKVTLLIVAASNKLTTRMRTMFEEIGLNPIVLTNELSVFSDFMVNTLKPTGSGLSLAVNFGYSGSSFYIFSNPTQSLINFHTVKFGMNLFIKELLYNLDIPESKAIEALKTIGLSPNDKLSINNVIAPLMQEFSSEVNRFIFQIHEKTNLTIDQILVYNCNNTILQFENTLGALLKRPVYAVSMKGYVSENPVSHSFSSELSSLISPIASSISL